MHNYYLNIYIYVCLYFKENEGETKASFPLILHYDELYNYFIKYHNIRYSGSIPGSGRSPGGGHGNPLQYSCLENPMDRGAWQAVVHRVAKSQT